MRHRIGILLLLGRGALVCVALGLHASVVRPGMLLLHKLFDKRQPLADVLGLRFDFGHGELGLDIHLFELQGVLVVDHLTLLLNQEPLELAAEAIKGFGERVTQSIENQFCLR